MLTDQEELQESLNTQEKLPEFNNFSISYAIHMHPITQLKSPTLSVDLFFIEKLKMDT